MSQQNLKTNPNIFFCVQRHLVEKTGTEVPKDELAVLMKGGVLWKRISDELTYSELYGSMDNVWR